MKVGFIGGKFLPLHLGHVNAIIEASNQCDKLYIILSYSKVRDKNLCEQGNIKNISHSIRLFWLRHLASKLPNTKVISIEDFAESNEEYNWEDGAQKIKDLIPEKIDLIFSSEEEYTKIFNKLYPKSKHIIIDSNREKIPISATKIRNNGPYKSWNFLPDFVKPFFVKKVVVVGTESCGKSTLVKNLALAFNTNYVEEYGRTICDKLYGSDDVLTEEKYPLIAYGHKMLEEEKIQKSNKILFVDTEVLVTKFYYELYTKKKSKLFDEIASFQNYDLWIFLESDVPWIDDGTRRHGKDKIRLNNSKKLKKILKKQDIKYVSIKGDYQNRYLKVYSLSKNLLSEDI
jgi:HTH-type transcriptional repressor of NAD biosynthesis genes